MKPERAQMGKKGEWNVWASQRTNNSTLHIRWLCASVCARMGWRKRTWKYSTHSHIVSQSVRERTNEATRTRACACLRHRIYCVKHEYRNCVKSTTTHKGDNRKAKESNTNSMLAHTQTLTEWRTDTSTLAHQPASKPPSAYISYSKHTYKRHAHSQAPLLSRAIDGEREHWTEWSKL